METAVHIKLRMEPCKHPCGTPASSVVCTAASLFTNCRCCLWTVNRSFLEQLCGGLLSYEDAKGLPLVLQQHQVSDTCWMRDISMPHLERPNSYAWLFMVDLAQPVKNILPHGMLSLATLVLLWDVCIIGNKMNKNK